MHRYIYSRNAEKFFECCVLDGHEINETGKMSFVHLALKIIYSF